VILGSGAFFLGLAAYLTNSSDPKPNPSEKSTKSPDKTDLKEIHVVIRTEHDLEPKRKPLHSQYATPKMIIVDNNTSCPLHHIIVQKFLEASKFRFSIDCNGNNVGPLSNHQQMIEFVEKAANGIIAEAKLWGVTHPNEKEAAEHAALFMANEMLEQIEENPIAIFKVAVRQFTLDTFLNTVVYEALSKEDLSRTQTLGPFIYLLHGFITMTSAKIINEDIPTQMYKYTGQAYKVATLSLEDIEGYRNLLNENSDLLKTNLSSTTQKKRRLFRWNTATSATSSEGAAFGWIKAYKMNTLFEIRIDEQSAFCGSDIRNISEVRMELEVQLPMQATFYVENIQKVVDPRYPTLEYKISLKTGEKPEAIIQNSPIYF